MLDTNKRADNHIVGFFVYLLSRPLVCVSRVLIKAMYRNEPTRTRKRRRAGR